MKFLRNILDNLEPNFEKGGKLEKLYPLYDAIDTILYVPSETAEHGPYVRDHIDVKRSMIFVVLALLPCLLFGIYNAGLQSAINSSSESRGFIDLFLAGSFAVIPMYIVVFSVGGACEAIFAVIRKHEINEGFLVTGFLIPLTMPPTVPLWMLAIATIFGIVIGKEIFGGTGYNIFNPALIYEDMEEWLHETPLIKRLFRDAAVISGLIERRHPGQVKTGRQVLISSDLIFDVLMKYEPQHILLKAAYQDAKTNLIEAGRLENFLNS